ncbi:MAG: hypothetical protein KGJ93_00705 [Patescibacteria group bacterium]|nr:hypothetical protein [Patescibacteria group bacterium]
MPAQNTRGGLNALASRLKQGENMWDLGILKIINGKESPVATPPLGQYNVKICIERDGKLYETHKFEAVSNGTIRIVFDEQKPQAAAPA